MSTNAAQQLELVDLLQIYGNIDYQWDVNNDRIKWHGPLNRLISPDIILETGSSFNHLLSVESFEQRIRAISESLLSPDSYYSAIYTLHLSSYEQAYVLEEGQILKKNGKLTALQGYIRFINATQFSDPMHLPSANQHAGYDPITKLPGREVTFENLAAVVESCTHNKIPGAYLALSIDNLTKIGIEYGIDVVHKIFRELIDRLRPIIRNTDHIGRVSSCCLGLILNECDHHSIVNVANRLIDTVRENPFLSHDQSALTIDISSGATLFPSTSIPTSMLMTHAEKSLFEMQTFKYSQDFNKLQSINLSIPHNVGLKSDVQKRRIRDL